MLVPLTRRRRYLALAVAATTLAAGWALPASAQAITPVQIQGHVTAIANAGVPGVIAWDRQFKYVAGHHALPDAPMTQSDTQIKAGSLSKTFLATVVLQLVDQGKIDLDKPVSTYLDTTGFAQVPVTVPGRKADDFSRITIRQLLHQTSGVDDYLNTLTALVRSPADVQAVLDHPALTPAQLIAIAVGQGSLSAPGTQFHYSNTNYVLLQLIVQAVTGTAVAELIDTRIVKPLGLTDTFVDGYGGRTYAGPHGYLPIDGTIVDVTSLGPWVAPGAGDMITSGRDAILFLTILTRTSQLLSLQMLSEMTSNLVPSDDTGENWYGLGIEQTRLPCAGGIAYWGHEGDFPGYGLYGGVQTTGAHAFVAAVTESSPPQLSDAMRGLVGDVMCTGGFYSGHE